MITRPLSSLSAVRKQHLLIELFAISSSSAKSFADALNSSSLKHACPHGVYMSLTPGDPTLWSGVIFVREGPYAPAILRFQISFPASYPSLPPLVTFSTDIFHPLITPLTTYMYTTDIQDSGTVSATDEERLPPGGFSLRDGFPGWFGRGARRSAERIRGRGGLIQTPPRGSLEVSRVGSPGSGRGSLSSLRTGESSGGTAGSRSRGVKEGVSVYEVLRYIRSTFDDGKVLDEIPLEAAGNPGAWHAWRSHRIKTGDITLAPVVPKVDKENNARHDEMSEDEECNGSGSVPEGYQRLAGGTSAPQAARQPGEWNWEGVWEVRVKRGIDASLAEAVLFGNSAGDDLIRFLHMEGGEVENVMENIKRSLESVEPQQRGVS